MGTGPAVDAVNVSMGILGRPRVQSVFLWEFWAGRGYSQCFYGNSGPAAGTVTLLPARGWSGVLSLTGVTTRGMTVLLTRLTGED